MLKSNARRVGVVAWPFVIGALLLAACGSDDDASPTQSTIELNNGSTAFVVREPATTVSNEDGAGTNAASQEYTVQAGDYPLGVAQQFGVSLEDLVNFNDWDSAAEFPFPGETIRIPPGATNQNANQGRNNNRNNDDTEAADDTDDADDEESGDTIPDAGDNCEEGSYTITADDTSRLAVAEKFDVTVEELDEVNRGTPGYDAFYPGLEIVIPAKDDC